MGRIPAVKFFKVYLFNDTVNNPDRIVPVSYTHLDVYKRQPEEHIEDIVNVVRYADELDIAVNVYLEDWSNGMKDSSSSWWRSQTTPPARMRATPPLRGTWTMPCS